MSFEIFVVVVFFIAMIAMGLAGSAYWDIVFLKHQIDILNVIVSKQNDISRMQNENIEELLNALGKRK